MKRSHVVYLIVLAAAHLASPVATSQPAEPSDIPPEMQPDTSPDAQPAGPELGVAGTSGRSPDREGPDFVGLWSLSREWCAAPGEDRQPIEITQEKFGPDCTFAELEQHGDEWRATLSCKREGEQSEERITMTAIENLLNVTAHDLGNQNLTYYRCELQD